MDDKISDFFKKFDPNVLKALDGLNISKIIKQLEQLKISGLLERLEDLNRLSKLLTQMDDIKMSEIVKKIEDIKLSNILKQIEDNKLPEMLNNIPNPLKQLKLDSSDSQPIIRIENRSDSIPDQIKKLAELKNMGIITQEELNQKKKQLLDRM